MRLYRLRGPGLEGLRLEEADVPRPGRRQVLVRLRAASLNYRDLMVLDGSYGGGRGVADGLIPLSDGAGEVVETGPDVTRFEVGARVAPIFFQGWIAGGMERAAWQTALGGAVDGVLAEYRVFEEEGLVRLPDHLDFAEGATLPCAAVTAWSALFDGVPLVAGQSVLLLGTGGVSIFALQFARLAGARVIATTSSETKRARLETYGPLDTINYATTPDWEREVLRLTGRRGVDHVVEVGGAGTLPRSIRATAAGGQVHLIGVLTGGTIDPAGILHGAVTVRGVRVGSRASFEAMNAAIAHHALRPVIDRRFGFEEAAAAYEHLRAAGHFGKVVIDFGDQAAGRS